eukprot:TRINITY_DN14304_c0_g1_i1.p1 TRINITY_DN14304_c0_g1~~TRINITY_DN14304_c0_g1_i1.p1  ORF type:complete len:172 (+),score=23.79 TRINITY_DN14304_c0_g1_i1:140-655(+)
MKRSQPEPPTKPKSFLDLETLMKGMFDYTVSHMSEKGLYRISSFFHSSFAFPDLSWDKVYFSFLEELLSDNDEILHPQDFVYLQFSSTHNAECVISAEDYKKLISNYKDQNRTLPLERDSGTTEVSWDEGIARVIEGNVNPMKFSLVVAANEITETKQGKALELISNIEPI